MHSVVSAALGMLDFESTFVLTRDYSTTAQLNVLHNVFGSCVWNLCDYLAPRSNM